MQTHLNSYFQLPEQLHLVFRDQLGESDKETSQQPRHSVEGDSRPGVFNPDGEEQQPREAETDNVPADDCEATKPDEFGRSPYSFEVAAREGESDDRDDELGSDIKSLRLCSKLR